jgi:hypothetical protein
LLARHIDLRFVWAIVVQDDLAAYRFLERSATNRMAHLRYFDELVDVRAWMLGQSHLACQDFSFALA